MAGKAVPDKAAWMMLGHAEVVARAIRGEAVAPAKLGK
jgi:hypothetical protein